MRTPSKLTLINDLLRPYGLRCYTWTPGDGQTRYLFSRDLDATYSSARPVCCVLSASEADLVCSVWIQGYEAGQGDDDGQGFEEKDAGYPDREEV